MISALNAFGAYRLADKTDSSTSVAIGLSLAAVVLSPLTAWLTYRFVTLPRMLRESEEKRTADRDDRVRTETRRWAAPIQASVQDLRFRLHNIVEDGGYVPLSPEWVPRRDWSITFDHFRTSTMYLFSVYFCYTELFRTSLSFELFRSQKDKDALLDAVVQVSSALGSYPAPWGAAPVDTQVFRLQQRAIGQLVAVPEADPPRCMTYPEFFAKHDDVEFARHVEPLSMLLTGVSPAQGDGRLARLEQVRDGLVALEKVCSHILMPRDGEAE